MAYSSKPEDHAKAVDEALLRLIVPFASPHTCRRGEHLMDMGEAADTFFFVDSGTFEVSYMARNTSIVVALIGPGNFIGEIGFFDGMPRTRTIRAIEDASLQRFDRTAMRRMQEENPTLHTRFLEFLLRSLCERFRNVLVDRGPLTAYSALLSTGKERFMGLQLLPSNLLGSQEWLQVYQGLEEFKANMFEAAYRLRKEKQQEISPDLRSEIESILDGFRDRIPEFGEIIQKCDSPDLLWGYAFKEAFPYFMRSRFYERAYYKPKGYAGDFFMIELIYQNKPDGDGKLGQVMDGWALKQIACRAVRNRRRLLEHMLDNFSRQRLTITDRLNIINLACGPARELFDLIKHCDYGKHINALCIDIDPEALQFADQNVNTFVHQANIRFMYENVIKWSLGRAKQDFGAQDVIYSSGLCDYLDRRLLLALINRCYKQLKPGGFFIMGNFAPTNPDRLFMDHLLYWRLIYRDEAELKAVFNESAFGGALEIVAEEEGINLFVVAQR
jgi:CRP-like cAMP-binding protein/SAM-dependent methyltransferase